MTDVRDCMKIRTFIQGAEVFPDLTSLKVNDECCHLGVCGDCLVRWGIFQCEEAQTKDKKLIMKGERRFTWKERKRERHRLDWRTSAADNLFLKKGWPENTTCGLKMVYLSPVVLVIASGQGSVKRIHVQLSERASISNASLLLVREKISAVQLHAQPAVHVSLGRSGTLKRTLGNLICSFEI